MLGLLATAVALLPALASAQDPTYHLISKRSSSHNGLTKRFVDEQGNTNISIIHTNDIHAHLDEFVRGGGDCDPADGDVCFGGYARLKTQIDALRASRNNDSLLLDAGDEFQGTLFYSTAPNGALLAPVLNEIGYDVGTLGNHEFDNGEGPLSEFIASLNYPITVANVQTESNLSTLLQPYVIFPELSLAVISVLTPETKTIASPAESTNITDPVTAIQATVDTVLSTENVTRIIALTHIGYAEDIALAQATRNISLIVGGHSHTPLGNITGVESAGDYPTIETNLDGDEVFIVTSYRWGYALGHIDVAFDQDNKIVSYSGGPITMLNTTAQNETIQGLVTEARQPFAAYSSEVVGEAQVALNGSCYDGECAMGSIMCDAFIWYREQAGATVDGSLQNAGGVRASIEAGNITRSDVLNVFPFGNSVVDVSFTGQELIDVFEGIVSGVNPETGAPIGGFVQVGGMEFTYNPELPVGQRLLSLNVGNSSVVPTQNYTIVTIDFVAGGGDSFFEKEFSAVLETQDAVLEQYIEAFSPIGAPTTGRINTSATTERNVTASTPQVSGSAAASASASASASSGVLENPNASAASVLPSASSLPSAAARLARWL